MLSVVLWQWLQVKRALLGTSSPDKQVVSMDPSAGFVERPEVFADLGGKSLEVVIQAGKQAKAATGANAISWIAPGESAGRARIWIPEKQIVAHIT
jgi:hypothetical protein